MRLFSKKKSIKKWIALVALLVAVISVGGYLGYGYLRSKADCAKDIPKESGIVSEDAINCSLYKAIRAQDSSLCRIVTEEIRDRDYLRRHEDECFYRYAVRQRYQAACENIINTETRGKCTATVQGVFDNQEDIAYCWSLDSERIAQCLMELAVKRNSTLICDTAPAGTLKADEYRDACLWKYATYTSDPSKCLLITDTNKQKSCLNRLSGVKENEESIGGCQALAEDINKHSEAYRCFLRTAIEILNPAICRVKNSENVELTDIMDACFTGYAIARKDPVICDSIENKYDLEKCQKILDLVQKYPYGLECWNQMELTSYMAGSMMSCLLDQAARERNPEVCNLGITMDNNFAMEIADDQNTCFMMYAIENMKPEVCDKLFENGTAVGPYATPTECRRRIELKKKYPEFTDYGAFWTQIAILLKDESYCEYEQQFNDSIVLTPLENCRKHVEVVKKYPNAQIEAYDSWANVAQKTGDAKYCDYHAGPTKNRMEFCLKGMKPKQPEGFTFD